MKKYHLIILMCLATLVINAQKNQLKKDVKIIEKKIDQIHKNNKTTLKQELKTINNRLKNKEINKETADSLKKSIIDKNEKELKEKTAIEFKNIEKLYADHRKTREKTIEESTFSRSKLGKNITSIIVEEKVALKKEIEAIENKLKAGEISTIEAENLKKSAATISAQNMEKRIALEELELKKIIQDYTDNQIVTTSVDTIEVVRIYGNGKNKKKNYTFKYTPERLEDYKTSIEKSNQNRFYEAGVIAFGLNNVINKGELSSNYKLWNSKFYEYGYTYKYRLSKNFSPFYLRFGGSILFNNLKTEDNLYHVKSDSQTDLLTYPKSLKESRLKNVQLILPIHFEIDFSKPSFVDGVKSYRYSNRETFRLGLGGYAGFRLHSRQILRYKEDGIYVKEKSTDDFNLNNFTYGISGYFGYRSMSLYAKYDINTLFKNSEGRGISLGLRLEI